MCKIAASIQCTTALAGLDGSLTEGKMTLCWAIENKEGEKCRISGPGMVDGDTDINDSTRAERGRRVGILDVITHIAKTFNLSRSHVTVLIDNQQALKYGTSPKQGDGPFKHLADDYNLKCWASIFEKDLERNHNVLLTY